MTSQRIVTEPRIPGWTVYRRPEHYRAVCDADPSLVVEHLNPGRLAEACAAITRPPHRTSSVQAPLGGTGA